MDILEVGMGPMMGIGVTTLAEGAIAAVKLVFNTSTLCEFAPTSSPDARVWY